MDIDLNIENYNLNDFLNLFKLDINFNENDLKKVKKLVLKVHPDKSGLDKKYFLFYCKAFHILENIFQFRKKRYNNVTEANYDNEYKYNDVNKSDKILLDKFLSNKNNNFNKWFNEQFENLNKDKNTNADGYGDWIKSDNDFNFLDNNLSKNEVQNLVQLRKNKLSSIVKSNQISDFYNNNNSSLLDDSKPDEYTSDVFGKLIYDDLKKVYSESVIPVCEDDYNNCLKFNNVESYKKFRNTQNIEPINKKESEKILQNKNKLDEELSSNLAYKLYLQEQESKQKNKKLWKNLKLLS